MSWPCEGPGISTICLEHIDFWDRKGVIRREGPTEVGQHCSQLTSFNTLRLILNAPASIPHTLIQFLEGSEELAVHAQTIWHINNMVQFGLEVCTRLSMKGSELSSLLSFSSLSLSLCLILFVVPRSRPSMHQDQHRIQGLVIFFLLFLSFMPSFYLLSHFIFTKWDYHILLLLYWSFLWGLRACLWCEEFNIRLWYLT